MAFKKVMPKLNHGDYPDLALGIELVYPVKEDLLPQVID